MNTPIIITLGSDVDRKVIFGKPQCSGGREGGGGGRRECGGCETADPKDEAFVVVI